MNIEQLRPADVQQRLADGWRPLLIDVREAWERELATLPEEKFETLALPISLFPAKLPELLQQVASDQPLLCLCHHGIRSWHAACMITGCEPNRLGGVFNLAGGIDAWSLEADSEVPRY